MLKIVSTLILFLPTLLAANEGFTIVMENIRDRIEVCYSDAEYEDQETAQCLRFSVEDSGSVERMGFKTEEMAFVTPLKDTYVFGEFNIEIDNALPNGPSQMFSCHEGCIFTYQQRQVFVSDFRGEKLLESKDHVLARTWRAVRLPEAPTKPWDNPLDDEGAPTIDIPDGLGDPDNPSCEFGC